MKEVLKFMTELSDYPKSDCVRVFDIEAISIPIVYNKYGDYDPNGMMYVLKRIPSVFSEKQEKGFR